MIVNKKSLSFGRYLKAVRLEKGIDLEKVSEETKIGMDYLLLIEKEDHDRLPADVFVKGFLRAYAQAVGADSDEAVQLYMTSRQTFQDAAEFDADLKKSGQAFWPRLLLSIGVLAAIMVLSVLMISVFNSRSVQDGLKSKVSSPIDSDIPKKELQKPSAVIGRPKKGLEKLLLKVVTVEDTWMKIAIDSQSPKEYSLKPGDSLELEAASRYNILVGNAGGVRLTLNGNPVEIVGKHGQVEHIHIP